MTGLYSVKPWFVRSLAGLEDALVSHGVRADTLSYAAVLVSAGAGIAVVTGYYVDPFWWFFLAPLCVVRLALNALDGSVARRSGTARPFGRVINELCDRLSDVFMLVPLVVFIAPPLLLIAVVVVWLVSLCGSLGDVVGTERLTQGPMGKADRCAVMAVAGTVAGLTENDATFAAALTVIAVGGTLTLAARLRSLHAMARRESHVR